MTRTRRALGAAAVGTAALLLIGPFLVPVPPLADTVPPEELADPDSCFVEVRGVRVHYKRFGQGEPTFLLLHGFAASLFSWRQVTGPLAEQGTVIAYDRPAFGLTERPMPGEWGEANPYTSDFQVALTVGLMDALGIERVILVGNSAGGTISALTTLAHPERVQALVLVDAAVYSERRTTDLLRPLLRTPQMRHLGPLIARRIRSWGIDFARSAWHDPAGLTPEVWEGYLKPLRAENWDRALWELTAAPRGARGVERLNAITAPTLVVSGDDDRVVPSAQSVRLATEIPGAELVVIPACGHVPHEECPEAFLQAVLAFVDGLLPAGR